MAAVHPTNLLCSLSPSVAFSVPLYHHLPICFWAEPHQTSCSLLLQSQKFTSPAQLYSFVTAPLTEALSNVSDSWSEQKHHQTSHLPPDPDSHTSTFPEPSEQYWTQSHLIFHFLFSTLLEPKWKIYFFSLVLSVGEQERESDRFSMRAS